MHPRLVELTSDLTALAGGDGLAVNQIVKPHLVPGPINMYHWVAFTAAHMGRHTAQIRETGSAIEAPR